MYNFVDSNSVLQVESLHCILNHSPFDLIREVVGPLEFVGEVVYVFWESCMLMHIVCKVCTMI